MSLSRFLKTCIPVSTNQLLYTLFQLINLALISSLGSIVVVLAGSIATAFAVFNAIMDGARLALIQDTVKKYVGFQYFRTVLLLGICVVVLFRFFLALWFPLVVGQYSDHYDISMYQNIALIQALFVMLHYIFTGILYGNYKEKWVTGITLGGAVGQTLLTVLIIYTNIFPFPKYFVSVITAVFAFGIECILDVVLITILQKDNTLQIARTHITAFLKSALPISIERAGVLFGFMLVFSAIAAFPPDDIAGYVLITRIIGIAFLAAYGVETVLTREVNKEKRIQENLNILKLSLYSTSILGGVIVLLEFVFKSIIIHLELLSISPNSFPVISFSLSIALIIQFINFAQIITSGFLRALNQKLFVSISNIVIFTIILPLGIYLLHWPSNNLSSLWIFIGTIYFLALVVFSIRIILYVRQHNYEQYDFLNKVSVK